MKAISRFILLLAFLAAAPGFALAYDRNHVARLLEEQSWPELLALAAEVPSQEQDVYLLNALGYAAYQSALPEKAAGFYRTSLEHDAGNPSALLYLGQISKQSLKLADAIRYFRQLVQVKPGNVRYLKLLADCYLETSLTDTALAYLRQANSLVPGDPGIANSLAGILLERKMYKPADSLLQRALQVHADNAVLLSAYIKSRYLQKKYSDVLSYTQLLEKTGNITYAPFMYAMIAAVQLKQYTECIRLGGLLDDAGSATELSIYYQAKAYAGLRDYARSNDLLRRCLKSAISENVELYYTDLGDNMEHLNQYRQAQRSYDTALYLSHNPMLLYRKALAYDAMKQPDQAGKNFRNFLKAAPDADSSLRNYIQSRLKQR